MFGVWNPMKYFKRTLAFNDYARLSSYGIVKHRREFSLYTYNVISVGYRLLPYTNFTFALDLEGIIFVQIW